MRVDLTINVPTILSIVGLVSAVSAWGVNVYSDLDKRQLRTDLAVVDIRSRLDKTETAMANLKTDTGVQSQLLRTEMKSDIGEIKTMLNQIIFNGVAPPRPTQQQLNEWRKPQ